MKSHSRKTKVHCHGHLNGWAAKEMKEKGVVLKKPNLHKQATKASGMKEQKKNELVLVNPKSQRFEKDSSRKEDISQFDT